MAPGSTAEEHRYLFADVVLRSEHPLEDLLPATGRRADDCRIRWPSVDPESRDGGEIVYESPRLFITRHEGIHEANYCDGARFVVRRGGGTIDCYGTPSRRKTLHYLLDHILPRALDLQGRTVLHAGAVEVDGKAVLLVGKSGAGKSTLAALLGRSYGNLLCDDAVHIREHNGSLWTVPTYACLRLKPGSPTGIEPARLHPIDPVACSRPLAMVLLLSPRPADCPEPVALEVVRPRDIFEELVGNALSFQPAEPATMKRHFLLVRRIRDEIPVVRLAYRRDRSGLGKIAERVVQYVRSCGSARPGQC